MINYTYKELGDYILYLLRPDYSNYVFVSRVTTSINLEAKNQIKVYYNLRNINNTSSMENSIIIDLNDLSTWTKVNQRNNTIDKIIM